MGLMMWCVNLAGLFLTLAKSTTTELANDQVCSSSLEAAHGGDHCPRPWDPKHAPNQASPRSYAPDCFDYSGGTPRSSSRTVCLFNDNDFRQNHGVSIVTTPEVGADLVGSGALLDVEDMPWPHPRPLFVPGPVSAGEVPAYEVRSLPGKGKGVVASRKVEKGETFMLDYPAIILSDDFEEDGKPKVKESVLEKAISRLPEATRLQVLGLAKSYQSDRIKLPLLDIMDTNTCQVALGDHVLHIGLFPEIARMNHACNPNAFFRFSQRSLTMEAIAFRDISPGEEITINYAPLGMPYGIRRSYLHQKWGFHCQCALCKASLGEREESDDRRMGIVHARRSMEEACAAGSWDQAILHMEEVVALAKEEGLDPLLPGYWHTMAELYLEKGDFSNAMHHSRRALEGWLELRSPESAQVEAAEALLGRIQTKTASNKSEEG